MNPEKPARIDVPVTDSIEELRKENGTGEKADEAQLGVTNEDVKDLASDADGG